MGLLDSLGKLAGTAMPGLGFLGGALKINEIGGPFAGLGRGLRGALDPGNTRLPGAGFQLGQGQEALDIGGQTLLDILRSGGRTDPTLFNLQIGDVMRAGEGRVQDIEGDAARRGLSNFLGVDALKAATRQGASRDAAQIRAQETQLAEQRKRDDLMLLLDLIIGPELQRFGIESGVAVEDRRRKDERNQALLNALFQGLLAGFSR